jgi:subtilisin family serine protease
VRLLSAVDRLMRVLSVGASRTAVPGAQPADDEAIWSAARDGGALDDREVLARMRRSGWKFYKWGEATASQLARVAIDPCGRLGLLSGRVVVTTRPGIVILDLPPAMVLSARNAFGRPDCHIVTLKPGHSPAAFLELDQVRSQIDRHEIEFVRSVDELQQVGVAAWWERFRPFAWWSSWTTTTKTGESHWARVGVDGSITGKGFRVGLIDSGFDDEHPNIAHAFDPKRSFQIEVTGPCHFITTTGAFPDPASSHGTEAASLIVARPANTDDLTGIACDADIAAVSIGSDESEVALAVAVESLVDCGVDVISSTKRLNAKPTCKLSSLSMELAVAYAGKKGRGGHGAPVLWAISRDAGKLADHPVYSVDGVWPIAALQGTKRQKGMDGPEMLAVAPGFNVVAAVANGGIGNVRNMGGHSLATSIASAVVVCSLQAAASPPTLDDLKKAIKAGCCQIDTSPDDWWGSGVINLQRAIASLNGGNLPVCP